MFCSVHCHKFDYGSDVPHIVRQNIAKCKRTVFNFSWCDTYLLCIWTSVINTYAIVWILINLLRYCQKCLYSVQFILHDMFKNIMYIEGSFLDNIIFQVCQEVLDFYTLGSNNQRVRYHSVCRVGPEILFINNTRKSWCHNSWFVSYIVRLDKCHTYWLGLYPKWFPLNMDISTPFSDVWNINIIIIMLIA